MSHFKKQYFNTTDHGSLQWKNKLFWMLLDRSPLLNSGKFYPPEIKN